MALNLFPDVYDVLEKKFGKDEAKEIVKTLDFALKAVDHKAEETVASIKDKADFLITQKKFELKDELTKELATKADVAELKGVFKADIVRLEGEIQTVRQEIQTVRQEIQTVRQEIQTVRQEIKTAKVELDRKYTIMFLVLLFAIVFLNQNALEFIAKLLGLI
jgi:chromosome segregation ATPase